MTGTLSLANEASRKLLLELKYLADNIGMVFFFWSVTGTLSLAHEVRYPGRQKG